MSSTQDSPSGLPVPGAVSRRGALCMLGAGAGTALLGTFGQSPTVASAQTELVGATPYVIMHRFQAVSGALPGALRQAVETDLLPKMALGQGFLDSFVFDTSLGEVISISLYANKEGANATYVVADSWTVASLAGSYTDVLSFGSNMTNVTSVSSTPSMGMPTPWEPPNPFVGATGGCENCIIQPYPALPGIINRAVNWEIISAEAIDQGQLPDFEIPE